MAVLEPAERARLKGFIVNKLRGDPALFAEGLSQIATRTGLPCLGLVPWFEDARLLPAEDSAGLDSRPYPVARAGGARVKIAVARLPRIANFDDFDPLAAEPNVDLAFVPPSQALPGDADAIILPGSKATRADLAAFRQAGWDIDLRAHVRPLGRDRTLHRDLEAVERLIRTGSLLAAVEAVCGKLE